MITMVSYKGQTKKTRKTKIDKNALWNTFDMEIPKDSTPLECIYINSNDRDKCDLCESSLAITEEGFIGCTNDKCGIIYKDILDQSAEWRYYGANDNNSCDPTRCGMPINPLLKESSFGCKVVCQGKTTYEMRKIRRYTEWQSMPYREKSQYDEFQRILIMAQNSGIPKLIIDDAMRYHKTISEQKTFRGLNRDGIIAASIYISCRINDYPRTAKEIALIFYLDNTSATKGCKNAMQILNTFESQMDNDNKTIFCKTKPVSFIDRYCSKLSINTELTKVCNFVAIRIDKNNLIPENTPQSIAAGIVYFIAQVCMLNISKKDVNNVSNTSEVTINKCYKKLENMKSELIPKIILDKYS
jgi:transcription initiation factor TFIIB